MKWFKEIFLKSFEDCRGRRITEKQANIFIKYLPNREDLFGFNATYYSGLIDNREIRVQESSTCCGRSYRQEYFLTIKTK